jgi:hypothetical protein
MTAFLLVVRDNYLNLEIYTIEGWLDRRRCFQYLDNMHCCEELSFRNLNSSFYLCLVAINLDIWLEELLHFLYVPCIGQLVYTPTGICSELNDWRLRRAHNWFGGWEIGVGREWGRGGQFTSNPGPRWMTIAPRKEEGFQVSRRDPGERGVVKGLRRGLVSLICVYALWYCVNAATKRIVFRL